MINKSLQLLLGFILILLLASFVFSNVSDSIKNDLLSKTKSTLQDKGIEEIEVEVEGEGLGLTRTIILKGSVYSETQKKQITSMIDEISGIASVDNQIAVTSPNYYKGSNTAVPPREKCSLISQKEVNHKNLKAEITTEEVQASKLIKAKELEISQEPIKSKEVVAPVKAVDVSSQTLPKVVKPIDVSTIKVITPAQSTVEIPKVVDVVKVVEVAKEGEK